MYYTEMRDGIAVSTTTPARDEMGRTQRGAYECRLDWKTYERATEIAGQLNAAQAAAHQREVAARAVGAPVPALPPQWVPTDAGSGCYPRYDVVQLPAIGAPVSKAFNGDYYPAGVVTSVSKTLTVIRTSDGSTFRRRRLTGAWVSGGTWSMVAGHRDELNPSF